MRREVRKEEDIAQLTKTDKSRQAKSNGHAAHSDAKSARSLQRDQVKQILDYVELYLGGCPERAYGTFQVSSHWETWPVRSTGFRRWLALWFFAQHQTPLSGQAAQDIINHLEAVAHREGRCHEVELRVLRKGDSIFLDLCNDHWGVVEVTREGWNIVEARERPIARFRRSPGMVALPTPERGGSIDNLRPFVNAAEHETWCLTLAWLFGTLNPIGPYPILILQGEQGSAKSTTARVLKSLVDPGNPPLRSIPKDNRDLMISAKNARVLCYDNLSGTQRWFSDALCRLSTGGGMSTRQLHTDDEEHFFDAQRPVILNGIEDIALNPDLADRAIIVTLPAIREEKRQTERQFWESFEAERPQILGVLLDAISVALRKEGTVTLRTHPRMADFADWVRAASEGLPFTADEFLDVYMQNRCDSASVSREASPVATAVEKLCIQSRTWRGTATTLLDVLTQYASDEVRRSKEWPKDDFAILNWPTLII